MTDPREVVDASADRVVHTSGPDDGTTYGERDPAPYAALRAVLDLHQPEPGQHPDFCWHDKHQLPCPTLRAIVTALGGTPDRPRPLPGLARNSIVGEVTGTVVQAGNVGELRF